MRVPLNWLKDFVEITLPIEELAHRLTMAGIEVAAIKRIGLPAPARGEAPSPRHTWRVEEGGKRSPLAWDRDKIFVGEIVEIKPHPHADRLVLGVVDYGARLISAFASVIDSNDPDEIDKILDGLVDPAGQFYRFNLAGSLLRASKYAKSNGG